ncbi:dipeptide epimerase, partial [Enterococcus gallinarum]
AAKAAIDIACYDLMGQKAQLPLYQLLGGYDNQVITDITLGIDEPNVMAQKAVEKVKLGFDTLKIKVRTGIEADIARVKAIREAVGFD